MKHKDERNEGMMSRSTQKTPLVRLLQLVLLLPLMQRIAAWTIVPTPQQLRTTTHTITTTTQTTELAFLSITKRENALVFVSRKGSRRNHHHGIMTLSLSSNSNSNEDEDDPNKKKEDEEDDKDGAALAAQFFQLAQRKGIALDSMSDLLLDDDEEDEDEDDEKDEDDDEDDEYRNIPQGAINVFLGYDAGPGVEDTKLAAGNVSLTNDQLYSAVKERVLDTAGGFVQYVQGVQDDEDDDEEDDEADDNLLASLASSSSTLKKEKYEPPTMIPDAELTAGEVVLTVLQALRHNNIPTPNRGIEILFGFSSPTSSIVTTTPPLTPAEYADYLQETEYKVLLPPASGTTNTDDDEATTLSGQVTIEKAEYSANGQKAFFTARVASTASSKDPPVNVNFILSSCPYDPDVPFGQRRTFSSSSSSSSSSLVRSNNPGENDDEDDDDDQDEDNRNGTSRGDFCWLIDSILIRPESMRRRRRR